MKLGKIGGSQQTGRMARRLAAYVPKALAARVLRGDIPKPGQERRLLAASLFCDLSGFSLMAHELAADGPRGAEELNRALLMTFTAMINAIHNAGGVVSHFHGDAMMVYLPDDDGQAAERALACAQFMQNLIQGGYSQVIANRPANRQTVFELSMKVGVGYGECLEVVVGNPHESLEFIVAGNAIDEAVAAEALAQSGQVMASQAVLQKAHLPVTQPFRPLTEVLPVPFAQQPIHWDAYNTEQLWQLARLAAAFVPEALHERIMTDHAYFVAEHRPATSIFVRYEGIDYNQPHAGERLQEYYEWARRIIARFGGENSRINRVLTGDKGSVLHIIFGAPIAPEAPDQALRCALALQREKPDFISSQQIGLATGQVFACAVGSQNRREYTIVGDVVNLSARLMMRCPPGRVFTDQTTAEKAQKQIVFVPIGQEGFKGFAEPIEIVEATDVLQLKTLMRDRFNDDQQPLIWRKIEHEQLLQCVAEAVQGQNHNVAIFGSTSAEHTRLITAAVNQWFQLGGQVLAGMGQQHTAELPFGMWQGVWRDFFHLTPEMTLDKQVIAVLRQMAHYNPHFAREDMLLWCSQLGLPVSTTAQNNWSLENRLTRITMVMQMCFRAAAAEKPLLIVLENLQWIDPYSLRLLNEVAAHWTHAPVMVMMTFIPTADFTIAKLPPAVTIRLEELSVVEGREMVKQLLNGLEIPPTLMRHLGLNETEGLVNPIFLEESINLMLAEGVLRVNGHVHLDEPALAKLRIPDNVQSLLRARFDRVSASGRTLLQAASVIGRQFDLETLTQAIPDMSLQEAEPLLRELHEARMISTINSGSKTVYYFHDDMIQGVAYESIPYGRRQRWHAAVADWIFEQNRDNLQPYYPILAYHYGQTDLHERGLELALAAAKNAQSIIAPQAAIEFYTLAENHLVALEKTTRWSTRINVLLQRATLWFISSKFEAALQDVKQVVEIALQHKDGLHVGLGYNLMAQIKCRLGDNEEAIELTDLIIRGLANRIPLNKLGETWVTNAEALTYLGKFPQARASFKKALDLLSRTEDTAGLIHLHLLWGYEYSSMIGDWNEAREQFARARQLIEANANPLHTDLIRLYLGMAQVELRCGSKETAAEFLLQTQKIINELGVTWWRPVYLYFQAAIHLANKMFDQAHATLQEGLTAVQEGGNPDYLPLILLELAHLSNSGEQHGHYLTQCVTAAKQRARYLDRLHCLQVGRTLGL